MGISSSLRSLYQPVIGLEVHIQLLNKSKIFATDGFSFGDKPNHRLSTITLAHPGVLPSINRLCIEHAVKLGLALDCEISSRTYFDRKNYFYPDLPKGYQISQDGKPICMGGQLDVRMNNQYKTIRIHHIHLEEDAGKSLHDISDQYTYVDLNRAGVGLVELVTQPDLRSSQEAMIFLTEIRKLVRYLGISDGNMEKGNLRCDANVSVMLHEAKEYGTRVEIKNLNSFTFLGKAIEYEIDRQIQLVEDGGKVVQETRKWVVDKGITLPMRDKETADDYRYFPEPDLLPVEVSPGQLASIKASLPALPQQLLHTYIDQLGIPENEALAITEQKGLARYFDELRAMVDPKAAASWLLGPVKMYLNEQNIKIREFPLEPKQIARLIQVIHDRKISHDAAKNYVYPEMLLHPEEDPLDIAARLDVIMDSDGSEIKNFVKQLIQQFPEETQRYRNGKKGLLGFFVGQVMKQFKGKANPKEVNKVVRENLEK